MFLCANWAIFTVDWQPALVLSRIFRTEFRMQTISYCLAIYFCSAFLSFGAPTTAEPISALTPDQLQIALETLSRLDTNSLQNPTVQKALARVLVSVRATPQFVELVKRYNIRNQEDELLRLVVEKPDSQAAVEALKLLFETGATSRVHQNLDRKGDVALKTVIALGNLHQKQIVPLLLPLIVDSKRDIETRKQAVKSLAQVSEGAAALVTLARREQLPADLKLTASQELSAGRWPKIKQQAAELLPFPQSLNLESLPPIAELAKLQGDITKGEKVFFSEQTSCFKCHQAKGKGIGVGPNLTEIGDKLGRDALLEAILDPNAGVSLGFETYQLDLKSGDEAYGLLASDTPEEVAIKDLKGIVTHYKKSEIAKRAQLKTSIMPTGLQSTMTKQDLIDLVEFLVSLKKTVKP
jgi:putative heme-binding domain-containing protein